MKKIYSKPEIMFESFTLSENIAGDCAEPTGTPSEMQCAYGEDTDLGVAIFMDEITACIFKRPDGDNGICYHIPTETNNLFNS